MALVKWSEKYSVSVASIDEQHNVLFNAINDLHEAMMKGQARKVIGELLQRLLEYTRKHFSFEEQMLAKTSYPKLATHQQVHRDLTKQVEDFIVRHEKGELTLSNHLANFLSDWLAKHILETDKTYSSWVNERGVK
jgi:hemerythrin